MSELRLVYDIGMHRGQDTAYYLKRGFRVIGIEADPEHAAYCRNLFSEAITANRLVVLEGAISGDSAPRVLFHKNLENSHWGTVDPAWVKRNQLRGTHYQAIQVDRINLRACLERYGIPYFMKIDIEGADVLCLHALRGFTVMPSYLSLESDLKSFAGVEQEVRLLRELGYNAFRAVQQANLPARTRGVPLPGGITHSFEYGCSGPLPEEFPAHWHDARGVLGAYRRIFVLYRFLGTDSWLWHSRTGQAWIRQLGERIQGEIPGWYDTHARHASVSPK